MIMNEVYYEFNVHDADGNTVASGVTRTEEDAVSQGLLYLDHYKDDPEGPFTLNITKVTEVMTMVVGE